ncbi:UDP-glucose 4-epimerase GalE [Synechococcus elongatus]|uniref:UDP-glucose 4-epimerase n=2 Tax=Synechococcus elongatus TaxID=32046 RepID=Q31RG7_SYNE7|nr:UDP-glucose 4-epimerase GalE [Synechococcus elongatus]MBD2689253.1 UDP-glucose 4-epimerase GalE [Synechococcus elongatus FACHB-1061]ABB56352.1 UDP-galactose 4-epimerase [Synechococcus elongatus PCC 7942 = FACHB-805]AJD56599.1 UDP-galactose-4-epimerase [Synechococcus elongatus UTEX 2973]MBD2588185.1 UDP-glucose 4-epimerase GalE [Synechococcus elongatus FACHB-242]MBD2707107.1 UDP-glucose 4-epimerase GalE [Synechococcus elongatus PCC 7942 = FACHB-805]
MAGATILVTGGAGYIGSHTVRALQAQGYQPIVLDNLSNGQRAIAAEVLQVPLIVGDTRDRLLLDRLFAEHPIQAVIHFAASIEVGESVRDPGNFYANNVSGSLTLLQAMVAAGCQQLVFSSTCATYGLPQVIPIPEDHPQAPINPYGRSKWMVEQFLQDFQAAYGLRSVIFRYFNAAGADPKGDLGEAHDPETHLIPLVLQAAAGQRPSIQVYGTDYPTSDGTCIRDYIHVCDLADAHVRGLTYLADGGATTAFNLGNGNGFSVKEVIATAERVTQRSIPVQLSDRRPGDAIALVGSSDKARQILGWEPQFPSLETMIQHAWQWQQRCDRPS